MKKGKLVWIIIPVLLTTCSKEGAKENQKTTPARYTSKVQVEKPKVETVERLINAIGTLEPEQLVEVAPEVSGIISRISEDLIEGKVVKSGTILAELDRTQFELNVEQARASRLYAQADFKLAEQNYQRKKELYDQKVITQQQLDEAIAQLERARAELQRTEANLKIAEKALNDTIIRAPIDAEIQHKMIDIGSYVKAGQTIVELVNRKRLKLYFSVAEADATYLKIGNLAEITVLPVTDRSFEGTIYAIAPVGSQAKRSIEVFAWIDNKELLLHARLSARVTVRAEKREHSLTISRKALRVDSQGYHVLVVNDNKLYRATIKIGVEFEDRVEILEGITENSLVVVRSSSFANPGSEVEIIK